MKKIISLLMVFVMVISLAACSGKTTDSSGSPSASENPATDKKEGKIGFLAFSMKYDFQVKMSEGIERAAKERGYEYMVYDYGADPEQEDAGIETLIASGVKSFYGIFMSPQADAEKLKNYPEVATLSQSDDPGFNAKVDNDYNSLGNQFIEAVDKFRKENNIKEGEMASIWLTACENKDGSFYDAMMTMKEIFLDYCEKEGINYVSDQFANDDEEASNITEQLLNAYPNLRYIFAFNNGFAIAAANEIQAAVQDTSGYFVFSSEGDDESFRLIADESNPYRACAYNDVAETGYQVGLQLINWIENGEIKNVPVSRVLVDSSNVKDYLK